MTDHYNHEALGRTLEHGPDCLPLDRLAGPVSTEEQAHLDGCARCQTEHALLSLVDAETPASAAEQEDLRWVVARLERARSGAVTPIVRPARSPWLSVSRLLPLAASLAFAALIGYAVWDPEPGVRTPDAGQTVYRAAGIEGLRPSADVPAPPRTLEWSAFSGAATYDVEVSEVDGTSLWRGSTQTNRIELPPSLQARFTPGKTVLWRVTAKGPSGAALADSGTQRFRVSQPR